MTPQEQKPAPLEAEFLSWLSETRDLSPATVKAYRGVMRDFCRRMKVKDYRTVTLTQLDRYLALLSVAGLSRQTRRSRAFALKSLFWFLSRHGHIESNVSDEMKEPFKKLTEVTPIFTPEEIETLIFSWVAPPLEQQPEEPGQCFAWRLRAYEFAEVRDTACLALAYTCGLRVSEPGNLELRDYDLSGSRPALMIRQAKWSQRPVVLEVERRPQAYMQKYLAERARFGIESPALFPPVSGEGRPAGRGISANRLAEMFKRRILLSGIQPRGRRLTFHVLRYSICTHLYKAGDSPERLQIFMRHRQLETTMRYLRLGPFGSIQKQAHALMYWNVNRTVGRSTLEGEGTVENPK